MSEILKTNTALDFTIFSEFFKNISTCLLKKKQELVEYPKSIDFPIEAETDIRRLFFDIEHDRKSIMKIHELIGGSEGSLGKDPFPLFHSFANGMYRREMHAPKGYYLVGRIHKDEYFVNVLKGKLLVMSEFGSKEIEAPCSFKAKAGVKHIGFFLEDTVWVDTCSCKADNVSDAETELYCDTYEELDMTNNIIEGES